MVVFNEEPIRCGVLARRGAVAEARRTGSGRPCADARPCTRAAGCCCGSEQLLNGQSPAADVATRGAPRQDGRRMGGVGYTRMWDMQPVQQSARRWRWVRRERSSGHRESLLLHQPQIAAPPHRSSVQQAPPRSRTGVGKLGRGYSSPREGGSNA
eukprot:scaffold6331_cov403-Prasinococcus_capsulatus_cf.AAC.1